MAIQIPLAPQERIDRVGMPYQTATGGGPDAFGAGVGQALQQAGQVADRIDARFEADRERERKLDDFEAKKRYADFSIKASGLYEDAVRSTAADGKGLVANFDKGFDTMSKEFIESLPEHLRPEYEATLAQRRAASVIKARDQEYELQDKYQAKGIAEVASKGVQVAALNPNTIETQKRNVDTMLESSTLPEATKAELRKQSYQDIEKAALGTVAKSALSAKFESGKQGAEAIAYDRTGGWSYGTYQFASGGTVADGSSLSGFVAALKTEAPDLAKRLEDAGGAAAAREGKREFKDAWREVAKDPRFATLELAVVEKSLFAPTYNRVRETTGLEIEGRSEALKSVLFSTAMQHGAAGSGALWRDAFQGVDINKLSDGQIINQLYDERANVDRWFQSSTEEVKSSVAKRFREERRTALAMLSGGGSLDTFVRDVNVSDKIINDPQYASLDDGTKLKVLTDAEATVVKERAQQEREKKALQTANNNELSVSLVDGKAGETEIAAYEHNGRISPQQAESLRKKFVETNEINKTALGTQEELSAGVILNPNSPATTKKLNSIFASEKGAEKLIAGDVNYVQNTLVPRFEQTGVLTKDMLGNLEGVMRTGNPKQLAFVMNTLDVLERTNPQAFYDDVKDSVMEKNLAQWRILGPVLGAEKFSEHLQMSRDPIVIERQKKLQEVAKQQLSGKVRTDATIGVKQAAQDLDVDDGIVEASGASYVYDRAYEEMYSLTGSAEGSHRFATDSLRKEWGETTINGQPRYMRNPPEKYFEKMKINKSLDWMKQQTMDDVTQAIVMADNIPESTRSAMMEGRANGNYILEADTETRNSISQRRNPTWKVLVQDEYGRYTPLTRGGKIITMSYDYDAALAEATKQKSQEQTERAAGVAEYQDFQVEKTRQPMGTFPLGSKL
jgi:hypothetical protein